MAIVYSSFRNDHVLGFDFGRNTTRQVAKYSSQNLPCCLVNSDNIEQSTSIFNGMMYEGVRSTLEKIMPEEVRGVLPLQPSLIDESNYAKIDEQHSIEDTIIESKICPFCHEKAMHVGSHVNIKHGEAEKLMLAAAEQYISSQKKKSMGRKTDARLSQEADIMVASANYKWQHRDKHPNDLRKVQNSIQAIATSIVATQWLSCPALQISGSVLNEAIGGQDGQWPEQVNTKFTKHIENTIGRRDMKEHLERLLVQLTTLNNKS